MVGCNIVAQNARAGVAIGGGVAARTTDLFIGPARVAAAKTPWQNEYLVQRAAHFCAPVYMKRGNLFKYYKRPRYFSFSCTNGYKFGVVWARYKSSIGTVIKPPFGGDRGRDGGGETITLGKRIHINTHTHKNTFAYSVKYNTTLYLVCMQACVWVWLCVGVSLYVWACVCVKCGHSFVFRPRKHDPSKGIKNAYRKRFSPIPKSVYQPANACSTHLLRSPFRYWTIALTTSRRERAVFFFFLIPYCLTTKWLAK